jgi:site-specific DNA-cytosine methylase
MLKPVILSGKAMVSEAYCWIHERRCKANMGKHHEAGPPCIDWSVQGLAGRENGPTMEYTMAWIGLVRLLQPATFAHENVKGFPSYILEDMLQDLYVIGEAFCASNEFGWPDMRERVIRCGRHRIKAPEETTSWDDFSKVLHHSCELNWHDLFCASPCDIKEDLLWVQLRKQNYLMKTGSHTHKHNNVHVACYSLHPRSTQSMEFKTWLLW